MLSCRTHERLLLMPRANSATVHLLSCSILPKSVCFAWLLLICCTILYLHQGIDHNHTPTLLSGSLELSIDGANWFFLPLKANLTANKTSFSVRLKLIISVLWVPHYVRRGYCLFLKKKTSFFNPSSGIQTCLKKKVHASMSSMFIHIHMITQLLDVHTVCFHSSTLPAYVCQICNRLFFWIKLSGPLIQRAFVFPTTRGKCWRRGRVMSRLTVCVDFPCGNTTGSYIIEQDLCECAGCLYDNWKSGQTFLEKLLPCKHNLWTPISVNMLTRCAVLLIKSSYGTPSAFSSNVDRSSVN